MTFVQLPHSVLQRGVEGVFVKPELLQQDTCFERVNDIVVVVTVKSANFEVCETSPVWCKMPQTDNLTPSIFGAATSGIVTGTHVVYDVTDRVYKFLDGSGEPGHSGTLMRSTTRPYRPLGVYFGIASKISMRPRGIVVPLPAFEEFTMLSTHVFTTDTVPSHYLGNPVRPLADGQPGQYEVQDKDNHELWWPGVFVDKNVPFTGSVVAGSCRCR
jgi:hypothetical protein